METEESKELEAIWNQIDTSEANTYSEKEFFKKMKEW
jgi:hypothetical protein